MLLRMKLVHAALSVGNWEIEQVTKNLLEADAVPLKTFDMLKRDVFSLE
jgi:hypothetical protein